MKLRFVWIGKTRRLPIRELVKEYVERMYAPALARQAKVEL